MKRKILVYAIAFLLLTQVFVFDSLSVRQVNSMTTPIVTLNNYSPDADGVEYKITFSTASGQELMPGDYIEIRGFHVLNMPSQSFYPGTLKVNGYDATYGSSSWPDGSSTDDTSDYQVLIRIPNNITNSAQNITITFSGLKNPPLQSIWDTNNHYENNPGKNQWRLKIRTSREDRDDVWSLPYTISPPQVSNVNVSLSSNIVSKVSSYDIGFRTGSNGELHGGSSTITVMFPSGTNLPASISTSAVTVKVGSNIANSSSVTPSGQSVTVLMPGSLYAGNNTEVHLIFSENAGIQNPSTPRDDYFVQVKTSSEDNFVSSTYYSIFPSKVESVSVNASPNTVSTNAVYTISFRTSLTGALSKNTSYIFVVFPEGTFVPPTIPSNSITVNSTTVPSCDVVDTRTLKIKVPLDIGGNNTVNVLISLSAGVKNPSTAKNDYKVSVYTTADPGTALSNAYPITESTIAPASVTVSPPIIRVNSSYIITFTVGSSGALQSGDKIYITFPGDTFVLNSISASSVSVNGVNCTQNPSVSGTKVTVYVPQFVSNNSSVILVFSPSAGIKNPSTPKIDYKLLISTSSEQSSVYSNPFEIKDSVKSSLIISPAPPDGKNGFYITQPKVKIDVSNPAGIKFSAYYKLGNDSFKSYQSGYEIIIPEGDYTLYYYAEDTYGNKEDVKEAQFKVDLTKPILTITLPENGVKLHTNTVTIQGKTDPGSTLTVNDVNVNLESDGSFTYIFTFVKEGTASIEVKSEDTAGNFNKVNITATYTRQVRIMLQVGNDHCYVNDTDYKLDAAPFIKNGRVMVPVRFVSEALGFNVEWDQIFKIVSIYMDNKRIRLQVGTITADLFGKAVSLDSPPVVANSRTFVPLRFIAENFGSSISWDESLKVVRIVYPKE